jgi:hypothetical protein
MACLPSRHEMRLPRKRGCFCLSFCLPFFVSFAGLLCYSCSVHTLLFARCVPAGRGGVFSLASARAFLFAPSLFLYAFCVIFILLCRTSSLPRSWPRCLSSPPLLCSLPCCRGKQQAEDRMASQAEFLRKRHDCRMHSTRKLFR